MGNDQDWRRKYFGRRGGRERGPLDGLVPAPMLERPSDAMAALRAENAAEADRAETFEREYVRQVVEKRRRERMEDLRAQVREFGAAAVERVNRQRDPSFRLPEELREREGSE